MTLRREAQSDEHLSGAHRDGAHCLCHPCKPLALLKEADQKSLVSVLPLLCTLRHPVCHDLPGHPDRHGESALRPLRPDRRCAYILVLWRPLRSVHRLLYHGLCCTVPSLIRLRTSAAFALYFWRTGSHRAKNSDRTMCSRSFILESIRATLPCQTIM